MGNKREFSPKGCRRTSQSRAANSVSRPAKPRRFFSYRSLRARSNSRQSKARARVRLIHVSTLAVRCEPIPSLERTLARGPCGDARPFVHLLISLNLSARANGRAHFPRRLNVRPIPCPLPGDRVEPRNRRTHRKYDRCLERAVRNPVCGADPTHRVAQIFDRPTRRKQQLQARGALCRAGARGGHRLSRRARVRPLQ